MIRMIRWSASSDVQEEIRGSSETAFDNKESLYVTTRITSDSSKIKNFYAKYFLRSSLFFLFFEKLSMKSLGNFVSSLNTNWFPVPRFFQVPPFKLFPKYWSAKMFKHVSSKFFKCSKHLLTNYLTYHQ